MFILFQAHINGLNEMNWKQLFETKIFQQLVFTFELIVEELIYQV